MVSNETQVSHYQWKELKVSKKEGQNIPCDVGLELEISVGSHKFNVYI